MTHSIITTAIFGYLGVSVVSFIVLMMVMAGGRREE